MFIIIQTGLPVVQVSKSVSATDIRALSLFILLLALSRRQENKSVSATDSSPLVLCLVRGGGGGGAY